MYEQQSIAGAGIGLRSKHYPDIINKKPDIKWFEVLSENYFGDGGLPLHHLRQIREHYPITLHGVGMSLGSADPLNLDYMAKLKKLADEFQPTYISDHLAWNSIDGRHLHELLPLPYTEESLAHFAERLDQAQDYLNRRILIENPSSYLTFSDSDIPEWEFIKQLAKMTDCGLLLDINNLFVSARNHRFDPLTYLRALPGDRIKEIHLAGYEEQEHFLFDTHGYRVKPPVWALYQFAIERFGPVPTLIEWDTDIPTLDTLMDEAAKADAIMDKVMKCN